MTVSTRSTLRATPAQNATENLAVSFSSLAKIATYAMSAIRKKKISMSVTDANKELTGSLRYMSAINNIEINTKNYLEQIYVIYN